MSTRFFTNEGENTLLRKFEGVFTHNPDIRWFDALVGFFRASGYFAVRPFLGNVPEIRVLVGIDVDALVAESHARGLLFQGDPARAVREVMAALREDVKGARYAREVEAGILQFVADVASGKLAVRAHPSKALHAKIYIFRPDPFNEHHAGCVITGSSNLTDAGLGVGERANYEFNVLLNGYEDVHFATAEFGKLWAEGVPILPVEVGRLPASTHLNDAFTPFEVYMKFLIEYFGTGVEFDPGSVSDLPPGFMRLSYQADAVQQGFDMLRRHGGFFLADVVGLGKTVMATLIAKKFFYTNGYPSYTSRTLIVVPPALKRDWDDTLEVFGLPNYHIVTNGSLHRIRHPETYDLVIVDEAHKFRNDTAQAYTQLQVLCKTPTRRVLPDGTKARKKVILVSATPLNNRPEDIRNLVYLFQDARESTLPVGNLNAFFAKRIDEYRAARKLPDMDQVREAVKRIYAAIREQVISPLTVRRTRRDLMENDAYRADLQKQGIHFPRVDKPRKVLYQLDPVLDALYDRTIALLTDPEKGLTYNRYRAIQFMVPTKKVKYQNADMLSAQLAKIMKTLLVKRLDSSFHAFRQSLRRFRDATQAMVTMFEAGRIYIAPNLDVNEYILEDREEELIERIEALRETDPTIEVCTSADFLSGFADGLVHDLATLDCLVREWEEVQADPKLDVFLERLEGELLDPILNPGGRLVIFSESRETTQYLAEALKQHGYDRLLSVHAGNRQALRASVRANFDANIPAAEQKDEVAMLISTEVLGEGLNLHRANVVVNYDTPWNSTRLMQRIGRVNRIGSVAPVVFNYVFYPTAKVDDDIELRKRAIMKLQAFHAALGEDSQIYSLEEETGSFGLFDQDIEEERDEALALLMELRAFREREPVRFREIRSLPVRARCGRKDKTRSASTVVFVRNRHRDGFYFVGADGNQETLTFVQAARIFEARVQEKAIPLHDRHHEQVQVAEAEFQQQVQQEIAARKVVDTRQGPQEKKALAFLDACGGMPLTGASERSLIAEAKKAVRAGRFQQLVRDVNTLQGTQRKLKSSFVVLLDALLAILGKYPLGADADQESAPKPPRSSTDLRPEIVISQSFG